MQCPTSLLECIICHQFDLGSAVEYTVFRLLLSSLPVVAMKLLFAGGVHFLCWGIFSGSCPVAERERARRT